MKQSASTTNFGKRINLELRKAGKEKTYRLVPEFLSSKFNF
jgi:hypothetical protein